MRRLLLVVAAVLVLVLGIVSCAPSTAPTPIPAVISVTNLSASPLQIQTGEAVAITVVVTNTGGMEGIYPLVIKINGVKYVEEIMTIAAGSISTGSYSATINEAGNYTVTVGELNSSFTVVGPKPAITKVECEYYLQTYRRYEQEANQCLTLAGEYLDLVQDAQNEAMRYGNMGAQTQSDRFWELRDQYMSTYERYMDKASHAKDEARKYYGLYLECKDSD